MQQKYPNAIRIDNDDNVAVLVDNVEVGMKVLVKTGNTSMTIISKDIIRKGHKIALMDIKKGENIIKYGESIGIATRDIQTGQHVHIHNVESIRGRISNEI